MATVDFETHGAATHVEVKAKVGARHIAVAKIDLDNAVARLSIHADPYYQLDRREAHALLIRGFSESAQLQAEIVSLTSQDLIIRDEARRLNLRGILRAPLVGKLSKVLESVEFADEGEPLDNQNFLATIDELRGSSTWRVARTRSRLRRARTHSAIIAIEWCPGSQFWLCVPLTDDLIPEAVVMAVDTASHVLSRFAKYAGAFKMLKISDRTSGIKHGDHGAVADRKRRTVYLGEAQVDAHARIITRRARLARQSTETLASNPVVYLPHFPIDWLIAHETWHMVESEVKRIDMKQWLSVVDDLASWLGVETLNHAIRGVNEAARPEWRAAHSRLKALSPVAAASVPELTAELFAAWWCRGVDVDPLVARYGELMERL